MTNVTLTIDQREVTVPVGTTLWDAARGAAIEIPVLCHDPKLEPVGVCRVCAVEVEGERVFAAACVREAAEGMVVHTHSEKLERCRDMLTELLLSEQPDTSAREQTTAGSGPVCPGSRARPVLGRDRSRPPSLHPLRPVYPGLRRRPAQ